MLFVPSPFVLSVVAQSLLVLSVVLLCLDSILVIHGGIFELIESVSEGSGVILVVDDFSAAEKLASSTLLVFQMDTAAELFGWELRFSFLASAA